MSGLSRRRFLQLAGIALVGSAFDWSLTHTPTTSETHGRALVAAAVHESPAAASTVLSRLWPDSVSRILDARGDWYRLPQGYALRTALQPVLLHPPQVAVSPPGLPFWAEVSGAVAAVRTWCAADAPLVTRIGHGGTAHVVDFLPGDVTPWYGVASASGEWLGWTQALHWRPVEHVRDSEASIHIEINRRRLTVFDNNRPILQAPVALGAALESGMYPIQRRQAGDDPVLIGEKIFYGASWPLYFGERQHSLTGVYWHNQFGQPTPGPAVQVTPLLARWLYVRLADKGFVTIT